MNRRIGRFVESVTLVERDNFLADLSNRWRFGMTVPEAVRREQSLFNRISVDLVFRSPQVCQLEHKGDFMLTRLFETLKERYLDGSSSRLTLLSGATARTVARPPPRRPSTSQGTIQRSPR